MTGAFAQLQALLALRWQIARAPGLRLALFLGGLVVVWLLVGALGTADGLDDAALTTAAALAPQALLGVAVLALVAPLTAGGGAEVVPAAQLVAFPVRPGAQFLGGVLLAPLNLVWVVQLLVVAVEVSCLTVGGLRGLGVLTALAYVAFVTVLGQALGWTVTGLRQTRAGRRAGLVAVAALVAALAVRGDVARLLLDGAPARFVVRSVVAGGAGDLFSWAQGTALLLVALAAAGALGVAACTWALRSPPRPPGGGEVRLLGRRRPRTSALRELVALDRASVWRAPALRRGGLVLALLPGLLAAVAQLPWSSLVVLPGMVAAGTGLLFGINVFALDGSGAAWLASLPVQPALVVRAKLLVLTETVLAAVVPAAVAGAWRAPAGPTASELTAVVVAALACTAVVVSTGLHLSLRFPHRADLGGPRDAIAPPGALALAGVLLAVPTALLGLVLALAAASGDWELPLLLALPGIGLAGLSLRRSLRRWDDPAVRGRVVQAVARG